MLDELILHIGTHKTASTSIQRIFEGERRALRKQGITFPNSLTEPAGHPEMAWAIRENHSNRVPDKSAADIANAFLVQAEEECCSRLFISTEELWTLQSPMIVKLKSLFPAKKYKIFVFFRRQDAFLESVFNQHVRMASLRSGERMFEFFVRHGFFNRLNYRAIVNSWGSVFGQGSVTAATYEGANSRPNGILLKTIETLGVELDERTINRVLAQKRQNTSLSAAAVLALASINRNNKLDIARHRKVANSIERLDERSERVKRRLLSFEERKAFHQQYLTSNRNMLRFCGVEDELSHWNWDEVKEREYSCPTLEEVDYYFQKLRPTFPDLILDAAK